MENSSIKILAIDDNPDNLVIVKALISDVFPLAQVFLANSGNEGLLIASKEIPDVILLDIIMPEMDGYEVCKRIKANDALNDIPVVFITAIKEDKTSRIKALECGADGFLSKPIDDIELTAQIKAMKKIRDSNLKKKDEQAWLEALVLIRTKELEKELSERRKIEKALIENEEKFSKAFQNSPDVIIISTIDEGRIIDINSSIERVAGYTVEELVGKTTLEISLWKNEECRNNFVKEIKENQRISSFETIFRKKNGEFLSVIISSETLNLRGQKYILSVIHDITGRKIVEQELAERELQYRTLANHGLALIWQAGLDKLCFYFNDPWLKFTGRSLEQEYGNGWTEGVHPDDLEKCIEIYVNSFDKQITFDMEYRLRNFKGEYRWLRDFGTPNYNAAGEFIGYIGHCFDITEGKKAEEKHFSILKTAMDGFMVLSKNGKLLEVNQSYCKMSGYTEKELLKMNAYQLDLNEPNNAPDNELKYEVKDLQSHFESKHRRKDGSVFDVEVNLQKQKDDSGQIVAFLHDITERKLAQEKIQASHNLLAKLAAQVPGVVYQYRLFPDGSSCFPYSSPGMYDIYEVLPEEVQFDASPAFTRIHPDDYDMIVNTINHSAKNQTTYHSEFRVLLPSQGLRWRLCDAKPELLDDGSTLWSGIITDITERKFVEANLQKQLIYTKALNTIAEVIITKENPNEILESTNRIIGEALNLDRALIYDVSFKNNKIVGLCEWLRIDHPEIEATKGEYPLDMFLSPFTTILDSKKHLQSHHDAISTPFTSDESGSILHEKFKIKSLIWYPFSFHEDGYYLFTLNQILEKREWQHEEFVFLESVANQVSIALIKIKLLQEKKDSEKTLKESEEKYRTLFASNKDGISIFYINEDESLSPIKIANQAAAEMLGYSMEEIIGKNPTDFEFGISNKMIEDRMLALKKNGHYSFETSLKHVNGSLIHAEFNSSVIRYNNRLAIMNIVRDITERKQSEKQLLLLSKAIHQSPTTVVISDKFGNIEYVNPKFSEVTGYTYEEAKGQNPRILKSGDLSKAFYQNLWKTITSGKEWRGEFHNKKKNGESFWESAVISPLLNSKGEITNYVAAKEDITEKNKLIKDLILAKEKAEESDRLKSAFLANMSHEIRTPMNGILGFTELLKSPDLSGKKQLEFIGIIEKSGDRMLNIVNDIINISKIEANQVELVKSQTNVNEQLDFVFNFFEPEAKLKKLELLLIKPLHNQNAYIQTDREKLYAILTNLVKNALKFTHQGSIEIGYSVETKLSKAENNGILKFYVKDSGVGINDKQKDIVFIRFRQGSESLTRNYEGAGLGLSISKAYVELMGGKIWVENNDGGGSVFYFTLPFKKPQITEDINTLEDHSVNPTRHPSKIKVLIAEDDVDSQKLLTIVLKNLNYDLLIANDGLEAVNLCKKHSDIDLILMDIRMPVLDGYSAIEQIRSFNTKVIIIAQTAFALMGEHEKAMEAGCNDTLTKPININELILKIRKLLTLK